VAMTASELTTNSELIETFGRFVEGRGHPESGSVVMTRMADIVMMPTVVAMLAIGVPNDTTIVTFVGAKTEVG